MIPLWGKKICGKVTVDERRKTVMVVICVNANNKICTSDSKAKALVEDVPVGKAG